MTAKRKPKKRAPKKDKVEEAAPVVEDEAPAEEVEEPVEDVADEDESVEDSEEDVEAEEEAPEEEAPAEEEAPEEEAEPEEVPPSALDRAASELSSLIGSLTEAIEKVKAEDAPPGESHEQMRLGAARFLDEARAVLEANRTTVDELGEVIAAASKEAQKLEEARQSLSSRSDAYRAERDAFTVLHSLSDAQFQAALAYARKVEAGEDPAVEEEVSEDIPDVEEDEGGSEDVEE